VIYWQDSSQGKTNVIQELINKADQRGYITFDEIIELLEEDGDDITSIERG